MNLALFDFDGTITFRDTFAPFVRLACSKPRLFVGTVLLYPLLAAHRLGLVSATTLRTAIVYLAFSGCNVATVADLGTRCASTLPHVVRPEILDKIRWHQSNGDTVVVVSASLGAYLRPWCKSINVHFFCSELQTKGGILTGKYVGGDCTAGEKAKRVVEHYNLTDYALVYAYGDSREDEQLLELAHKRYLRGVELPALPHKATAASGAARSRPTGV